ENYEHTQIFSLGSIEGLERFTSIPKAELTVIAGSAAGMKFPLIKDVSTIGRKEGNDICLQDPNISRVHARIEQVEQDFTLIDMGSTNGTYINGKRVVKALVKPGDNIKLGKTELRFQVML
ncbi:MAG TPA: FHA domain-containing protein, partial [Bacillota bacterium]|nr:FHA domain-containing protein [Bacillota bacterium]